MAKKQVKTKPRWSELIPSTKQWYVEQMAEGKVTVKEVAERFGASYSTVYMAKYAWEKKHQKQEQVQKEFHESVVKDLNSVPTLEVQKVIDDYFEEDVDQQELTSPTRPVGDLLIPD